MAPQAGKQTIAIHISSNILRKKGNQQWRIQNDFHAGIPE